MCLYNTIKNGESRFLSIAMIGEKFSSVMFFGEPAKVISRGYMLCYGRMWNKKLPKIRKRSSLITYFAPKEFTPPPSGGRLGGGTPGHECNQY